MELINLENVRAVLEQYAQDVRNLYQDKLIRNDRIASGQLLNSVEYRVDYNGTEYEVKLTNLQEYWKWVEDDTKPHWPPFNAILEWVRIKPVIPRPDENGKLPTPRSLAYLIGRKISEVGTTGTHDLEQTIEEVNARYKGKLVYALQQDLQVITKVIVGEIQGTMPVIG